MYKLRQNTTLRRRSINRGDVVFLYASSGYHTSNIQCVFDPSLFFFTTFYSQRCAEMKTLYLLNRHILFFTFHIILYNLILIYDIR